MRRFVVALALVASSAAVLAVSASAISSPQVFNLLDVSQNVDQPIGGFTFDRAPVGGDQFAIYDKLYKWAGVKKGAPAGHVVGLGTFQTGFGENFSHPAKVLFVAQAYLPGGSVIVNGYGVTNPNGPSTFTLPVIGGTGRYDNARGYVVVRDLGNGNSNRSNVEFHLLP
jgi:hypothetical protein